MMKVAAERNSEWAEASLRRHVAVVIAAALLLVVGIAGWGGTTQLASAIIARGVVVVDDNVKKVQHLSGGRVKEIQVREGDHVRAGQTLFRLDETGVQAQLDSVEDELSSLYARRSRLQAELLGRTSFTVADEINGFKLSRSDYVKIEQQILASRLSGLEAMKSQLEQRQKQLDDEITGWNAQIRASDISLETSKVELDGLEKLLSQKIVSMQRVSPLRREYLNLEGQRGAQLAARAEARGKKNEIGLQMIQIEQDRQSENTKELSETEKLIAQKFELRRTLRDQLDRLDITSPVNGRALQVAVHTVGGIVGAGDTLLTVVPEKRQLSVETQIQTHDIDQIHIGQEVRVRFSAFNQRTTPEFEGRIGNIAADVVTDQTTHLSYYPVRIYLNEESLEELGSLVLYPGMPAEVFAKIADRTVVAYLMKPLSDQIQHVFREE